MLSRRDAASGVCGVGGNDQGVRDSKGTLCGFAGGVSSGPERNALRDNEGCSWILPLLRQPGWTPGAVREWLSRYRDVSAFGFYVFGASTSQLLAGRSCGLR